jgi:hypothetical protein
MFASEASSNAVNDAIIRLFLYGQDTAPSSYANENLIHPNDASTEYHFDARTYTQFRGQFRGHYT